MNKKKIKLYLLFAISVGLLLTGCKQDTKIKNKENLSKITVVTSPPYMPFVYEEDGVLNGYEPALWDEIGKRANLSIEWKTTDFSGLLGMIDSDRADVVSAQLTPNEDRIKKYDFSEPYNYSGYVIVTREDDNTIKNLSDLKNKKVGMGAGSDAMNVILENFNDGDVQVENYTTSTLSNMYNDVVFGRIDALIVQNVEAYLTIKNEQISCKVLEADLPTYGSSFAVKKGNTKLLSIINNALLDMKKDGTLNKLSEEYLGSDLTKDMN